jgi:hypothetical protein
MSLVGDIILQLRRRIPDAPYAFGPPSLYSATPITVPYQTLFTPGSGPMFLQMSVSNQWGETSVVNIPGIVLTGTQNAVQVNASAELGASVMNFYQGWNTPQSSWQRQSIPWPPPYGSGNQWTVDGVGNTPGTWPVVPSAPNPYGFVNGFWPPTRNTAFLPDTDGNFIGAFTAFDLLNTALKEMVRIAGGIIDVTGVQSQVNQSMYRLASPFYQFVNAWYDGYPTDIVPRNFMYLRNSAAGFSGIMSYEQDGPQSVIQVWPQSNRTGGQNQLAGNILANSNYFQLFAGASNFLSIGLAQIDSEIVAYSSVTPINLGPPPFNNLLQFNGVTRGMGGTDAVAHSANAPVTELNIRMSGYRMAKTYAVGNSAQTIMVPQAWETPLVLHMLSEVRSMEQDDATAKSLMTDFVQMAEKIARTSRIGKTKPRQIPIWGQNSSDARNVNGIGFGWLVN